MKKDNDFYEKLKNELEAFDVERVFPDELKKDNVVKMLSESTSKETEIVPLGSTRRIPSLRKLSAVAAAVVVIFAVGIMARNLRMFEEPVESAIVVEESERAANGNKISRFFKGIISFISDGDKDDVKSTTEASTDSKGNALPDSSEPYSAAKANGEDVSVTSGAEPGTDSHGEKATVSGKEDSSELGGEAIASTVPATKEENIETTTAEQVSPGMIFSQSLEQDEELSSYVDGSLADTVKKSVKQLPNMLEGNSSVFSYISGDEGIAYYTEQDPWQGTYSPSIRTQALCCDALALNFKSSGNEMRLRLRKGQYGCVLLGAEASLTKKSGTGEGAHYDGVALPVEMTLRKADSDGLSKTLFVRKCTDKSWISGYVPGLLNDANFDDRSCLSAELHITLPDEAAAASLIAALSAEGFTTADGTGTLQQKTYTVSATEVCFAW